MIFRKLELKNFRGIPEASLVFSEGGFVISGLNGSGKSSILYALGFAIYGSVPSLNLGDLLNWEAAAKKESGEVRLTFERDGGIFRITRTFNERASQAVVEEYIDREWVDRCKRLDESNLSSLANEEIRRIIQIPQKVFYEVVVKLQGTFGSLTETTPAGRYLFFREFSNSDIWEAYREKNDQILSSLTHQKTTLDQEFQSAHRAIHDLGLEPVSDEVIASHGEKLQEAEEERKRLRATRDQIIRYTAELERYKEAQRTITRLQDIGTWLERWNRVKDIQKPDVLFDPESLQKKEASLEAARAELATLPDRIQEIRNQEAEHTERIKVIEEELSGKRELHTETSEEIATRQGDVRRIQNEIKLIQEGKCPACSRPFRNVEERISALEDDLAKNQQDLGAAEENKRVLRLSITKLEQDLKFSRKTSDDAKNAMFALANQETELNRTITSLEQAISKLVASKEETEQYREQIKERDAFREEYPYGAMGPPEVAERAYTAAQAVQPPDPSLESGTTLEEVDAAIESLDQTIRTLSSEKQSLIEKKKNYEYQVERRDRSMAELEKLEPDIRRHERQKVVYGKQGAPKKVIERWISHVGHEVNRQLDRLTHGVFSIRFISKTDTGRDTIDLVIFDNVKGHERKYMTLSGGERTRINVAFSLALSKSFSDLRGISVDTIMYDEVYGLDEVGMQEYARIIEDVAKEKTIVGAVSCFETMSAYFARTVRVQEGELVGVA